MLTLIIGPDWMANSDEVLKRVARDVEQELPGTIMLVPELISHDMERRLCQRAGDTASRFAEVLSFTRLARRVADYRDIPIPACMDNGGRLVVMAAAARQLYSKLKAYASVLTNPEFLSGLLDAVDEYKRCCISPADLMAASHQTEGSLAQKLEELSLLMEGYEAICQNGKMDPRDQMTWLLHELEDCDFAQNHRLYVDGFSDLTRQHMAIVEHFMESGSPVVVSLTCDAPGSRQIAYEKAGQTARELLGFARRKDVSFQILRVEEGTARTRPVINELFQGQIRESYPQVLRTWRTDSVYQEVLAAAERIMELVSQGARYRDISILCGNMGTYKNVLEQVFARCRIPVYISGTEQILDKSVITTVLSAMDAALDGFGQTDVLRYLRSVLSPLTLEECDAIENYAVIWNISGSHWISPWTGHPQGLKTDWSHQDRQELEELNRLRSLAMGPLKDLRDGFRDSRNMAAQVKTIYRFMEQLGLARRLDRLAEQLDQAGDHRSAQVLDQLWRILIGAMEQLHDTLGDTIWDQETFTRLFRLLLSQYDVGTIPPVLDSVTAGPSSAMYCQRTKHLLVLGVVEGELPGYKGSSGVLSDQERTALRKLGLPLTGGDMEGVQAEFAAIYGSFSGASYSLDVYCPGGQPSFLFQRLTKLSGGISELPELLGPALADPVEAGAYLARFRAEDAAGELGIQEEYRRVLASCGYSMGQIQRSNIERLYGSRLQLSASQIDQQAQCRLSYFLQYGLKVRERKPAEIDPAEFGTFIHKVLEDTGRWAMDHGGFHQVSLEDTMSFALEAAKDYADTHFQQLDSARLSYLFSRNNQELQAVIRELWEELQNSDFEPVGFEVAFGTGADLPAVDISGAEMRASLTGYVDRVDQWKNQENYFRVVDYKSGTKDFDLCDIYNGVGLQMLLYLYSLQQKGQELLGKDAQCAGVQYFPARAPVVLVNEPSQEEIDKKQKPNRERKGLVLQEESVLDAMEKEQSSRMKALEPVTKEKLELLRKYVFSCVGQLVDEIASGSINPNPYMRGQDHSVCNYCPYGSICHVDTVEEIRNFKKMKAEDFWEKVERNVKENGR